MIPFACVSSSASELPSHPALFQLPETHSNRGITAATNLNTNDMGGAMPCRLGESCCLLVPWVKRAFGIENESGRMFHQPNKAFIQPQPETFIEAH